MKYMNSIVLCFFLTGAFVFGTHEARANTSYSINDKNFSLNEDGTLIVKEGVTKVSDGMFSQIDHTDKVENIVLPEGLKTIEGRAFKRFFNLKSIAFPSTAEFKPKDGFNLRIFSNSIVSGLKVIIHKNQMINFINHACSNIEQKEINWTIIDTESNQKLEKKFTPRIGNWNVYRTGSNWHKIPIEKKVIENVAPQSVNEQQSAADNNDADTVTGKVNIFNAKIEHNQKVSLQKKTKAPIKDNNLQKKEQINVGTQNGNVNSKRAFFESKKNK